MTDNEIRTISKDITRRLRNDLPVATSELENILAHTINSEFRGELMRRNHETELMARSGRNFREAN